MGKCFVVCLSDVGVAYMLEVEYSSYEERYQKTKGFAPYNVCETADEALNKVYWLNVH